MRKEAKHHRDLLKGSPQTSVRFHIQSKILLRTKLFQPFSKSLLARLDLGMRRFVFVERFEQINCRSSSEFLAFAQTATVTPSLKHALAVPSPIATH